MRNEVRPRRKPTPTKRAEAGTRQRILDTAERLFAQQGPAAVTLRSIAGAADVNVAAVNYHFGSKEKLFEEMFLRRVGPLNELRLARLEACLAEADGQPTLEAIVTAYIEPAVQLAEEGPNAHARAIIVQYSLGRVLALPEINDMLVRYYDRIRTQFVAALHGAAPHLTEYEIIWRYYWMGGCAMVSLAVPPDIVCRPGKGGRVRGARTSIAAELIAFLVQGFAPNTAANAGNLQLSAVS